MITLLNADAARPIAAKLSRARTGSDRNCKNVTADITPLILREKSRCSIRELNIRKSVAKMYEHRKQPVLSTARFLERVARHWLAGFGVLLFGLGGGVIGYHYIAGLSWIDSLLNAAMILGEWVP
jgi:hypothetical protein